jgi:hypothetical protein
LILSGSNFLIYQTSVNQAYSPLCDEGKAIFLLLPQKNRNARFFVKNYSILYAYQSILLDENGRMPVYVLGRKPETGDAYQTQPASGARSA